jgi:hypothetical protein
MVRSEATPRDLPVSERPGQVTVPAPAWHGLLDDAAMFPPASLPLPQAVEAHHAHRAAWYAPLLGAFVCPAAQLEHLGRVSAGRPLRVSLTLPAGPAGLSQAVAECTRLEELALTAVEVVLPDQMAPGEALAVMDGEVPPDVTAYLEVPRDGRAPAVLDALAATRHRAKFRTGGTRPSAHPGEHELAGAVVGAVRRGLAFKCTAGLHHAVRHTDGPLEQHGFLNLLLAVDAARQGADISAVVELLASRSAGEVARMVAAASDRLSAARTQFVSVGTCSVSDPVADLVGLGLVRPGGHDR